MQRVKYSELNARQKEIFNFQKVAARLADYGFNCIKLADDWQGADFLAYHNDGTTTLRVQLKGRVATYKKYMGKDLYMAFPVAEDWYLVEHDRLVELVGAHTTWLTSSSWNEQGGYSSARPNRQLLAALQGSRL